MIPSIWYATWHCSEKVTFDLLTPRVRGMGSVGKKIATMLLNFVVPLIWYATWYYSEKVELRPFDPNPRVRGWGSAGKIFSTMLLHSWVIPFNFIWCMALFWKKNWILFFRPVESGVGSVWAKYLLPCCCIRDPFNLICNTTMFWKIEFWPIDPSIRVRGGGSAGKYLRPSCCIRDSFNMICNITLFWKG